MRIALVTLAAIFVGVSLVSVAAFLCLPAGNMVGLPVGSMEVLIGREDFSLGAGDTLVGVVPHATLVVVLGIPSLVFLAYVFVLHRSEDRRRGFDVDVTPPRC